MNYTCFFFFPFKGEPILLSSQSANVGTTYHLAVYTGHRGGSGTTATPTLIMSGDNLDSPPLVLKSEKRQLFERGSVETFLVVLDQV